MTRKRYSHEITVDRPVADAFPLFTPRGEENWVPGWKPNYFAPEGGETKKDMLFATGEGAERTWWTCLDWQPEQHFVRYLRLTPGSRAAFVEIACRARDAETTLVKVSYDIQTLGAPGDCYIADMTDEKFAGMIGEWPRLIDEMKRAEQSPRP